jgi:hypothetical protein
MYLLRWPSDTHYPQKLALTSPTCGSRSVGIVRMRTKTTEFSFYVLHIITNVSFCTIYRSSVNPRFAKQIIPISLILRYNGSLVTWTVVSLTTAKFKPLIFSMSGFALSYAASMFILMILYHFCLLPSKYRHTVVYKWKAKSLVQIADRCTSCTMSSVAGNTAWQALQFQEVGVCRWFQGGVSIIHYRSNQCFMEG